MNTDNITVEMTRKEAEGIYRILCKCDTPFDALTKAIGLALIENPKPMTEDPRTYGRGFSDDKKAVGQALQDAGLGGKEDSMPWGKTPCDFWCAKWGACIHLGDVSIKSKEMARKSAQQCLNTYFVTQFDETYLEILTDEIRARGLWNDRRKGAGMKLMHGIPGGK